MTKKVDNNEEELDQIDYNNYKGYFYDEAEEKYQDELTGAHFEYFNMCLRLKRLKQQLEIERRDLDKEVPGPRIISTTIAKIAPDYDITDITKGSRNQVQELVAKKYETTISHSKIKQTLNSVKTRNDKKLNSQQNIGSRQNARNGKIQTNVKTHVAKPKEGNPIQVHLKYETFRDMYKIL